MPIYEFGYRHWEGERRSAAVRFWPIMRTGIRLTWSSKWLRRMLITAQIGMPFYVVMFCAVGWATQGGLQNVQEASRSFFGGMIVWAFGPQAAQKILANPTVLREAVWSLGFYWFFAITQMWLLLLVVSIVGPPLVARDIKSKAYLVYFSKPIGADTYLTGKLGVIAFFISLITLIPALALYALSMFFAPDLGAIVDTAPVLLRILACSIVVILPTSLLVLWLSSLTADEKFASFAWVGIFVFGEVLYLAVSQGGTREVGYAWLFCLRRVVLEVVADIFDVGGQMIELGVSERSRQWLTGGLDTERFLPSCVALLALCIFCALGLMRRVTAPVRI